MTTFGLTGMWYFMDLYGNFFVIVYADRAVLSFSFRVPKKSPYCLR